MHVKHLLLIATLALAACASNEPSDENLSEADLYRQAQSALDGKSYTNAVTKLKALESRYPFGRYAEQAQLELIYAYYKNGEPEAAKSAAERFIRLHPQHPSVDYAYYLKGLAAFDQDRGLMARFLPLEMSKRDPGAARDSYNEFARLTNRYPNSRYAPDAKQRMIYLRNVLAAYEVHVGNYYLKRNAYVSAANRGRYVVENFQETPAVGDGLALMVEAYQRLRLNDLADTSLAALKLNYPQHPSLVDGEFVPREKGDDERSWLAKATLGLIETDAPLPPGETRASQDVQRQFQDAEEALPEELKVDEPAKRSWWSRLTFGLFDGDKPKGGATALPFFICPVLPGL
jgi:outer membrane protein assembly factor BamD